RECVASHGRFEISRNVKSLTIDNMFLTNNLQQKAMHKRDDALCTQKTRKSFSDNDLSSPGRTRNSLFGRKLFIAGLICPDSMRKRDKLGTFSLTCYRSRCY